MNEPRQVPVRPVFAQCFAQTFHAPGVRETVSETEFSGIGTHHWYAFWRAQRAQFRAGCSHRGSRLWFAVLARTWLAATSAVTTKSYHFAWLPGTELPKVLARAGNEFR